MRAEPTRSRRTRPLAAVLAVALVPVLGGALTAPVQAAEPQPAKQATAVGTGGAVSTVDADATRVGLEVLRRGGNAVDAAVAAAAALGVTEPFSAGIGGGGYFVYYDAATKKVSTLDGRETGPRSLRVNTFTRPDGTPLDFQEARASGLSVGVPGTLQTWQDALAKWGTRSLDQVLLPAERLARDGFVVDATFRDQVAANEQVFETFSSSRDLFLPGGAPPAVGTRFRNPDLAESYRLVRVNGTGALYGGQLGQDLVRTVQRPPVAAQDSGWPYEVRPGGMTLSDLREYRVVPRPPTRIQYRGLDVYGMGPSSSGGTTVAEALNILETRDLRRTGRVDALHQYVEASALAFADRNRYVGDPAFVRVPQAQLLSQGFARERACQISPTTTLPRPVAPGSPDGTYGGCQAPQVADVKAQQEGMSTTNLTVADKDGNVVEYTLTIEQTGGSGIVVPRRGFLLNNELTDFNFVPTQGTAIDPNLPAPGKRPRSSMAPTIVLRDGEPLLAVGTPGGSTIITTVLQILVDRIDLGLSLPQAIADPRVSERNGTSTSVEAEFLLGPAADGLRDRGHVLTLSPEIGAATGIEFLRDGRLLAAAEPVRRGGGSAAVVTPSG